MQFVATFVVLAFSGLIDASFLVYKHITKEKKPMACPLNGECTKVTEGEFSKTFGVRNDILGILYYITALTGILFTIYFPSSRKLIYTLLLLMTVGGLSFSSFLVYIQARVIKQYCFYCLISAGINLLLFINAFHLFING